MPLVNNFIDLRWRGDLVAQLTASREARAKTIAALLDFVRKNNFAGLSLDFEDLPASAHKNFVRFVTELAAAFHAEKRTISVNVPATDPAFPYREIAAQVDQVIIMERVGSSATIVPGKQPSPSPDKTSRDCSYGTYRNAFAPKKRRHYG